MKWPLLKRIGMPTISNRVCPNPQNFFVNQHLANVPSGQTFGSKDCNLEKAPLGRHLINDAMANTYFQISIQAVFAVKNRENFIAHEWRYNLHKYLSGIILEMEQNRLLPSYHINGHTGLIP